MWLGYLEQHTIGADGRKRLGASARLARESEVVLDNPRDVAGWISRRVAELSTMADRDGSAMNALLVRHDGAYRGTAARGGSVYATVHLSRGRVADVCAEHRPDDSCAASAGGHNFQRNAKGEWRCTKCGQRM